MPPAMPFRATQSIVLPSSSRTVLGVLGNVLSLGQLLPAYFDDSRDLAAELNTL